jgi:hypothetical protein
MGNILIITNNLKEVFCGFWFQTFDFTTSHLSLIVDLTLGQTENSENEILEILKIYYNDSHPVDLLPLALLNMISPIKMENLNFVQTIISTPPKDIQHLIRANSIESNKTKLLSQLLLLENTTECYTGSCLFLFNINRFLFWDKLERKKYYSECCFMVSRILFSIR